MEECVLLFSLAATHVNGMLAHATTTTHYIYHRHAPPVSNVVSLVMIYLCLAAYNDCNQQQDKVPSPTTITTTIAVPRWTFRFLFNYHCGYLLLSYYL